MTTKRNSPILAEKLERERSADEALDTIVACLAILNGEVAKPAPLGRGDVARDLRAALLRLHIELSFVDNVPSLRGALRRAKLLDEQLEGPPVLAGDDVEDQLLADYTYAQPELSARLAAEADFEEDPEMGFGGRVFWFTYIAGVSTLAYLLAKWLLGA